jgi:hypothetical protein
MDAGSVRKPSLELQGSSSEATSKFLQFWGFEKENKGLGFSTTDFPRRMSHRDRLSCRAHILYRMAPPGTES